LQEVPERLQLRNAAPDGGGRAKESSMKLASLPCLPLLTAALVVSGLASSQAATVDEFAARVRREGVVKVARTWGQEATLDYLLWSKHPQDKSPDSQRELKQLREAATHAATDLGKIACDGDDKLVEFAVKAFADGIHVAANVLTSNVLAVTCASGRLQVSIKLPKGP
jgi:hypothetical protein